VKKPRIAVVSLTGCGGCRLELLYKLNEFLSMAKLTVLAKFSLLGRDCSGPYDIALVEGGVSTEEDEKALKELRNASKLLIALGSCACFGGAPQLENANMCSLSDYVDVDFQIPGCPILAEEAYHYLKKMLAGAKPALPLHPVCFECKLLESECFLDRGIACLGPITRGGCRALCLSVGEPCNGCRGLYEDSNLEAYLEQHLRVDRKKLLALASKYRRMWEMREHR